MRRATMKKEMNGRYVTLRRQKTTDCKVLISLLNDKDLYRFSHVPNPYTLKDAKKSMDYVNDRWTEGTLYEYVLVRKKTADIIGKISLKVDQDNNTAYMGQMIGRPYRGQGYIYEAAKLIMDQGFKALKLNRIALGCATENKKSAMVINNLGAKFEGILRSNICIGGKVYDQAIFSIIKKEWPEQKRRIESKIREKLDGAPPQSILPQY